MKSTAEKILDAWPGAVKQRDGTYRGNCPYRPDSDSNGFVLKIHDGEHGAYTDHPERTSGSLYELAEKMGIETPSGGRVQVADTKRAYDGLADYARRHHVEPDVFEAAGWAEQEVQGRPALVWSVNGQPSRVRFIDAQSAKSPYRWLKSGNQNQWYGLSRAIGKAAAAALPLVLCNGEASTVVAQHYGVPAFCGTGGEGAISDDMATELQSRWSGQIYIALDCDEAGRIAAEKVVERLENAQILDIGLTDGGDLADFCGLHRAQAMSALKRLARQQQSDENANQPQSFNIVFVDSNEVLSDFMRFAEDDPSLFGRVIRMPFAALRASGGFAERMTTKKIWLIGNVSGGGKTILSESLSDAWNRMGYNVLYIGSEWTQMELIARRVQRQSNHPIVSISQYLQYVDGEIEQFTDDQLDSIALAHREIRTFPGRLFYAQRQEGSTGVAFLEDVLEQAHRLSVDMRERGQRIDVVILDYLSLYDTRATANNLEEYKVGLFKSYCALMDVLGVSTVQVKKDAEDRVKRAGGYLTKHDLYWVRPDKANLITTMNQIYKSNLEANPEWPDDDTLHRPHIDPFGEPEPTGHFVMVTAKNSIASSNRHAYFHFDFARMRVNEGLNSEYRWSDRYRMILPLGHPRLEHKPDLSNL